MGDPLPAADLRWLCDESTLDFETTESVEPLTGVIGQTSAVEALRFGLETEAPGQNIFIRGLTGSGRMTMVRRLLEELGPKCTTKRDRCYVHNFTAPDRPRLLTLPPGRARSFRRRVHDLAEFIRDDLAPALNADAIKARRESLERRQKSRVDELSKPFEADLKEAGLGLVSVQLGPAATTAIFPLHEGQPVPPEEYEQLREQGIVDAEQYDRVTGGIESFQKRLEDLAEKIRDIRRRHARAIHSIVEETARAILGDLAREILVDFPGDDVKTFLSEVVDDVAENRLTLPPERMPDPRQRYGVNVILEHDDDEECPIIVENTPTLTNLLGGVEREWSASGPVPSDFQSVRAGSLLRADGGYLVVDVRDALVEPGAWKVLVRTLRTGMLEIVPSELSGALWSPSIKPEPIPVKMRVILLGDSHVFYGLDRHDPDFSNLFKVLADFDTEIEREPDGLRLYAGVLARIVRDEGLLPFHRSGVAALAEHGARIAARRGRLTSRFSRVADIAREASFVAKKGGRGRVERADVETTVRRTKERADLPSRRFQRLLKEGTIRVQTRGAVVGQINGLAVISAGPLTYGFPARITASISPGNAGIVDIEGRAALSGSIHTKGFHILGGLLRNLLKNDHPLAFSASLAFEQSYGGIDGDSASGAEMCCLLSALTDTPIKQSLAMTGAIDQMGAVQAIGGVNEKVEGFFDTCLHAGLTGEQGVVIPGANAGDLMLREDIVQACADGKFAVHAVDSIHEALEVLTGEPAGEMDEHGEYPDDTLLFEAVARAAEFWMMSNQSPKAYFGSDDEEDDA